MIAEPLRGVYQELQYLRVFDVLRGEHIQALLVSDTAENFVQRHLIVKLAEQARLPVLYPYREFVSIGGLMAYAVDVEDQFRRAAIYVDMILKGMKPGRYPSIKRTSSPSSSISKLPRRWESQSPQPYSGAPTR